MTARTFHGVIVECVRGNIANQPDMDAIVNAANAGLRPGGGVAGAIHRAAGAGLEEECRPLAPIRPGETVVTGGHDLPNRYVIHCLGPVFGFDEPFAEQLAACYRNALHVAEQNGMSSVAFPAISTGIFGYPVEPAARIALGTVIDALPRLSSVRHIRFVLFSAEDQRRYAQLLDEIPDRLPEG